MRIAWIAAIGLVGITHAQEAQNIAQQWDPTKKYYGQIEEVRTLQVAIYLCPTRRSAPALN